MPANRPLHTNPLRAARAEPPVELEPLLKPADMARLIGKSLRSLWRDIAAGSTPRPFYIGRSPRWRAGDVRAWLASLRPEVTR